MFAAAHAALRAGADEAPRAGAREDVRGQRQHQPQHLVRDGANLPLGAVAAAYGLFPEQTVATLTEQLEREVNDTSEGEEILFLTDLFHGSPFNAVVSLMRDHEFHHITGINIPLAVEVMMGRYADKSAEEICRGIMEAAPDTVKYVNDLFDDEEEEE